MCVCTLDLYTYISIVIGKIVWWYDNILLSSLGGCSNGRRAMLLVLVHHGVARPVSRDRLPAEHNIDTQWHPSGTGPAGLSWWHVSACVSETMPPGWTVNLILAFLDVLSHLLVKNYTLNKCEFSSYCAKKSLQRHQYNIGNFLIYNSGTLPHPTLYWEKNI